MNYQTSLWFGVEDSFLWISTNLFFNKVRFLGRAEIIKHSLIVFGFILLVFLDFFCLFAGHRTTDTDLSLHDLLTSRCVTELLLISDISNDGSLRSVFALWNFSEFFIVCFCRLFQMFLLRRHITCVLKRVNLLFWLFKIIWNGLVALYAVCSLWVESWTV